MDGMHICALWIADPERMALPPLSVGDDASKCTIGSHHTRVHCMCMCLDMPASDVLHIQLDADLSATSMLISIHYIDHCAQQFEHWDSPMCPKTVSACHDAIRPS